MKMFKTWGLANPALLILPIVLLKSFAYKFLCLCNAYGYLSSHAAKKFMTEFQKAFDI